MKKVGRLEFGGFILDVYDSLDDPKFLVSDIGNILDYSRGNNWALLHSCEEDEKITMPMVIGRQRRSTNFVTERGLYNILEQSTKPVARKWRRIINDELIDLRKSRGKNVVDQFADWNYKLDTIFMDPETGQMMQSVTIHGGDVIQIPYVKEEEEM